MIWRPVNCQWYLLRDSYRCLTACKVKKPAYVYTHENLFILLTPKGPFKANKPNKNGVQCHSVCPSIYFASFDSCKTDYHLVRAGVL